MTRKFLFCFPLRLGNIVFGYIVIIVSLAVAAFHIYLLSQIITRKEESHSEYEKHENIFGKENKSIFLISIIYYLLYIIAGLLLLLFSVVFTIGAHTVNRCCVTSFFVYSFIHIFLTIPLIVWEALTAGWIQLGLLVLSDVLLIICLFSVKYLMEAIRTGKIYSRPGSVLYKY
ncbi:uncharacterized protein LOC123697326 [Colias croceus]|uniref:uncharacterized protein LOC123697326 n=1 Tax=Colias crocea TaxID=72248 RepID=UPI001E27C8DB|nr:uncharacterized protein LOC123697326 [Colias croceus]XP_045499754.1 uncharacterized protein LOC123697326 [Colias croceus]